MAVQTVQAMLDMHISVPDVFIGVAFRFLEHPEVLLAAAATAGSYSNKRRWSGQWMKEPGPSAQRVLKEYHAALASTSDEETKQQRMENEQPGVLPGEAASGSVMPPEVAAFLGSFSAQAPPVRVAVRADVLSVIFQVHGDSVLPAWVRSCPWWSVLRIPHLLLVAVLCLPAPQKCMPFGVLKAVSAVCQVTDDVRACQRLCFV